MLRSPLLALALLLALLPSVSFADADPRFARLRDESVPLESLYGFLERYVGECKDLWAGKECKEKAKRFRAEANGRKYYMIITEDQANMLSPGPYNPSNGEFTVNIAPLFAAGGYAVTHGTPKKTDANGNPVMMFLQAKGSLGPEMTGMQFARMFSTRQLRVQVVFTPQEVWELPKKGGKHLGVTAKVHAILVTVGRTGEQVALWLDGGSAPAKGLKR